MNSSYIVTFVADDRPGLVEQLSVVIGPDRPGIVWEISRALARQDINVTQLDSSVNPAPMSAEMLFSARIRAWVPDTANLDGLRDTLDGIAEDMTLEIDLDRVD